MRPLSCLLLASSLALLSGCANQPQVTSDYDHGANFSQYHTYGFAPEVAGQYQTLTGKYIHSAIAQQMEQRGYTLSASPDLLVYSSAMKQNKVQVNDAPVPVGRRGYAGWGGYNQTVWSYTEGTLTVDLVDSKKKQLVWRGTASDTLNSDAQPASQAQIQQAVTALFAAYPFRAGAASR
ncbi:DUF4136 domain-containing protein [Serratia liquefaciens]|uniref:DUF4136 domain-containing protein n=1 Tax=Serratia liquefaciens TaxID=614 RepID=UPI0005CA299E|nr:DUF4136 domain-containing protein [Serratia liquefaciens]GAK26142.1 hypothetical protein SLIQ_05685 [Serratia liquefaciens FK01]